MLSAELFDFLWRSLPNLLLGFPTERPGGLLLSVMIAFGSIGIGFGISIIVGVLSTSRFRVVRLLTSVYINLGRALPLLFLLLFVHQFIGGRRFDLILQPIESAIIALTVYASAYFAETIKAGWLATPSNHIAAAKLLGGHSGRIMLLRLRYTLHHFWPALTNTIITIFKDTSVISVLAVTELTLVARATLSSDFQNTQYAVQLYIFVGLLYASVALLISQLAVSWSNPRSVKHHVTRLI